MLAKGEEASCARGGYANMEISYLLGSFKNENGAAIRTTNLRRYLDRAFMRRCRVSADFPPP